MTQVVLAPVIVGAALNTSFPQAVKKTAPFAPLVAVAVVVLIVASVIAQNAAAVTMAGQRLIASIVALHTGHPPTAAWIVGNASCLLAYMLVIGGSSEGPAAPCSFNCGRLLQLWSTAWSKYSALPQNGSLGLLGRICPHQLL